MKKAKRIGANPTNAKFGAASNLSPLPGLPEQFQALWQTPENSEYARHWYLRFTVQKQRAVK